MNKATSFTINFAPEQLLADAENQLKRSFGHAIDNQIMHFFTDKKVHGCNGNLEQITGPGALLINDWLEKKFDDPATQQKMFEYFEQNFERMLNAAMEKALERKANKLVFTKATQ